MSWRQTRKELEKVIGEMSYEERAYTATLQAREEVRIQGSDARLVECPECGKAAASVGEMECCNVECLDCGRVDSRPWGSGSPDWSGVPDSVRREIENKYGGGR